MHNETPKKSPHKRTRGHKLDKTIVLVGLMGVGKTTVGRRLARALGLDFIDSDHEIERAANMSVSDIFSSFGEEEFRSGERRVISRLMAGKPKIIATGGGAFINEETRALIKKHALSIWLDADIDILVERTGRRDTRPLLREGNPKEILIRLNEERAPLYALADIKVRSCQGPHENVVKDITKAINKKLSKRRHRRRSSNKTKSQNQPQQQKQNDS